MDQGEAEGSTAILTAIVIDGSRPTRHREAGDPLKVGEIIGHQRRGKGECMCGNQQVHGADRLAGLFQLVPDAAVKARRSIP